MKKKLLIIMAFVIPCSIVLMPVTSVLAASKSIKAIIWSVETTKIGQLLDNPSAKAIFVKHFPYVANGNQIWMARGMTLRQIQKHSHGYITDDKLAEMDKDLKTLPTISTK